MKKILSVLTITCLVSVFTVVGCGGDAGHENHEYGEWQIVNGVHQRTCTVDGCEEKQTKAHEYGEWQVAGEKHERSCSIDGCTAKESVAHEYGAITTSNGAHSHQCTACGATKSVAHELTQLVKSGKYHKRQCAIGGCGIEEIEKHVYSASTTNIDDKDYYYCTVEGCNALMQEHECSFAVCKDTGAKHEYECLYQMCVKTQSADHVYTDKFGAFIESGTQVKYVKTCKDCKHVSENDVISNSVIKITPANAYSVFSNIESGQILYFTAGDYGKYTISNSVSNVVIGGSAQASVQKITITGACNNLKFTQLNFDGTVQYDGLEMLNTVNGLMVYNCTFKTGSQICSLQYGQNKDVRYDITDLVVEDCKFNITVTNVSAINIYKLTNFTLRNCDFEKVKYNAAQVGNTYLNGNITIINNIFNDIGSRVLYFVKAESINECDISGNYFANNEDCDKSDGKYVNAGGSVYVEIGVNHWEMIPENNSTYFKGSTQYVYQEQFVWEK